MKNNSAKKAITSYYILSLLLTLPLLVPIWLIKESLWEIVYFVCILIYMRIAINFAVRATIMPSIWKELDADKYAAIINAKPFFVHYSYNLNLYLSIGDYQAAYNIISSIPLQHKNVRQRISGHLLICRICFERGDYKRLKESVDQIENYCKYNPAIKLGKYGKMAYEFYRAFSSADYVSACNISEKFIEKYSKKKSYNYSVLIRQYQLAVTKKIIGDIDEAITLFEEIKDRAPKLFLSTLAERQLEYISGTLEEKAPEHLEVTENISRKTSKKSRIFLIIFYLTCFILLIISEILLQLDKPMQEHKDLEYISKIESSLYDDYNDYQILGYFSIYPEYADTESVDSVFLVESDGKVDLHTLYKSGEELGNNLNVKDIQIDKSYVYENIFSKKIEFVLTKKKRNIPENARYYCEIDGYYFCVISVSDS